MKKIIFLILCAVSSVFTAVAQQSIRVSTVEGRPGNIVEVGVSLENTQAVTAMEMILPLDKMLQYVDGSAVLDVARKVDHQMSATMVDGKLKVYIYSGSLKPFKANSGQLFRFQLKLGSRPIDYNLVPQIVLSDVQGKSVTTEVLSGNAKIIAPELTIAATTFDYGRVPIRSSYERTMELQNSGTEAFEVTSIQTSNPDVVLSRSNLTIAPGASEYVTLTYSPKVRGDWKADVEVKSNAYNGNQTVKLTAQPYSVNELHVGEVEGRSDSIVDVSLRMNNMEPIVAMQCDFNLPEEVVYVEDSFQPAQRAAKHTAGGSLSNKKLSLFLYNGNNEAIAGEDGEIGHFKVRLNGHSSWNSRLEPQNVILSNKGTENMTSAVYGNRVVIQSPRLSASDVLNMGRGPVTTPLKATYSIYNNGQIDLIIDKVLFLAEGYKVITPLPLTVGRNETQSLEIAYESGVAADFSTTMNVYTNDPEQRMMKVNVKGSLFEPNELTLRGDNLENGDYQWTVGMDNYSDIVALQMDIHWLPGMETANENLMLSERLNGFSCMVNKIGDGVYRLMAYHMPNMVISGKTGDLFSLTYHSTGAVDYVGTPFTIDNILLSSGDGNQNSNSKPTVTQNAEKNHFSAVFKIVEEIVSKQFLKQGDPIVVPTAPEKAGYVFLGWGDVADTMPGNDVTYTGQYSLLGDVNNDHVIDVTDITGVVNLILNMSETTQNSKAADVNKDGAIDVTDITGIVNIILGIH